MKRFVIVGVAFALVGTAMSVGDASARASGSSDMREGRIGRLRSAGVVTVRDLHSSGTHPALPRPFLTRSQRTSAGEQRLGGSSGRASGVKTVLVPVMADGVRKAATDSTAAFEGMSYDRQVSLLGKSHAIGPPDTQLAAGPSSLLEMVNDSGSIWTKTGSLVTTFDLNALFQVANGFSFSDPRVVFDPAVSRWFASGLSFDAANDSNVYLAVSLTSDPAGAWIPYFAGPFMGVLTDQPKLGTSSDKIALSWNDYGSNGLFTGEETWIIEKADLVAGADSARTWAFPLDPTRFSVVPVVEQTESSTQYLVYNNADQFRNTSLPTVGVVAITGTPALNDVLWSETDPSIAGMRYPPKAEQPWGLALDTGDDRFLSAVSQGDVLWIGGNDKCTPARDSSARSCLRLIQLSTTTAPASVLQDFDVAAKGISLDYPALAIDGAGDVFFSFSAEGSDTYGSALTGGQLVGTTSLTPATLLKAGEGPYTWYQRSLGANRWGDYSGAAVDPADPSVVWMAAEYAATGEDTNNWGTEIGTQAAAAAPDTARPEITGVRDGPDPFSPNGDGKKDQTRIYWAVSEGSVVTTSITSKDEKLVFFVTGFVTKGKWFDVWNGRDRRHRRALPGTYRYTIKAVDAAGNQSRIAKGTITVVD